MKVKFFQVPAHGGEVEAELNRFLGGHRVLSIDRHFVGSPAGAHWAICVIYLDMSGAGSPPVRHGKIDYREVLSGPEFALFAKLRALRKKLAEQEGVPAYALFTNEQLAAMVRPGASTAADIAGIDGVGPARVAKYGAAFVALLQEHSLHGTAGTHETQCG